MPWRTPATIRAHCKIGWATATSSTPRATPSCRRRGSRTSGANEPAYPRAGWPRDNPASYRPVIADQVGTGGRQTKAAEAVRSDCALHRAVPTRFKDFWRESACLSTNRVGDDNLLSDHRYLRQYADSGPTLISIQIWSHPASAENAFRDGLVRGKMIEIHLKSRSSISICAEVSPEWRSALRAGAGVAMLALSQICP